MSKISIIIPAYNAGKTLAATVESVLSETLKDLELWIVDDGSKDDTGSIADSFAAKDSRVHVIHQDNQGTFRARLNALRQISTPYFGFVDADDVIEPLMHERMVAFAEENNLDVVQSDLFGQGTEEPPVIVIGREDIVRDVVRPWLFEGTGAALVWDKIYRRSCADGDFDVSYYSTFEDLVLNLHFFRNVKSFGHIHEGYYHYQVNGGSTTRNFSERNIEGFKEVLRARKTIGGMYDIDSNDGLFNMWTLMNASNLVRQATLAPAASNKVRVEHIKAVLSLEEVQEAMRNAPESAHFLCCVGNCPWVYVVKTRLVANARKFAKVCMGWN